jgi:hypothetical protein
MISLRDSVARLLLAQWEMHMERVAYQPYFDSRHLYDFDERLKQFPGSWITTGRSSINAGARQVIRLQWIIPGKPWASERGFLDFLDSYPHRLLLRCFLQKEASAEADKHHSYFSDSQKFWREEQLLECLGPGFTGEALQRALEFLSDQELITCQKNQWASALPLQMVGNFGQTFEWLVLARLQQDYQALARRCVSFKEWLSPPLGDLDILAFTGTQIISVECKAYTSFTSEHVLRFVQRARSFPATKAVLLIDTISADPLLKRIGQVNRFLNRGVDQFQKVVLHKKSVLVHVMGNIFIANTGGGIASTLEGLLRENVSNGENPQKRD